MSTEEPHPYSHPEPFDRAASLMQDMLADGLGARREVRYVDAAPESPKCSGWLAEVWLALATRASFVLLRVHLRRLR